MKKLLCMMGLALTTLTVAAQEDEGLPDGILALEWNFNPFDYESKPVKVAEIRARMFLDAKNAVRFGVGVGFDNDTDEESSHLTTQPTSPDNYTVTDELIKTTNNATTIKASIGYEYHFASTGRLDFYGGLEAGYLGRFFSAKEEISTTVNTVTNATGTASTTTTYTYDNTEYTKRDADGEKFNEQGIFGTLFTGVDFYVYKKLYIGAELGITYNMGKKSNGNYTQVTGTRQLLNGTAFAETATKYTSENGVTISNDGSTTTTTYGPINESTGKYNKVYIEPAIRIGWMF